MTDSQWVDENDPAAGFAVTVKRGSDGRKFTAAGKTFGEALDTAFDRAEVADGQGSLL